MMNRTPPRARGSDGGGLKGAREESVSCRGGGREVPAAGEAGRRGTGSTEEKVKDTDPYPADLRDLGEFRFIMVTRASGGPPDHGGRAPAPPRGVPHLSPSGRGTRRSGM